MATPKKACAKLYKMRFLNLMEKDGKTPLSSFQILPVSSECPIEGAIYDPSNKVLVIKTKIAHEETTMAKKLNSNGAPIMAKSNGSYVEAKERIKVLSVLENRLVDREDILDYVDTLCGGKTFTDGKTLEELLVKLDSFTIATAKK